MGNNFSDVDRVLGDSSRTPEELNPGKTRKYRPILRPTMAILQVFDDGRESCESFRIRKELTTIGRCECDVAISHDTLISSTHLQVKRVEIGGKSQWSIQDVSKNGTGLFVRVRRARLRNLSEFLVGAQRIMFTGACPMLFDAKSELSTRLDRGSIPGQSFESEGVSCASLSLLSKTKTLKIWLLGSEYWIGRSSDCALCISDDPYLAPKHARVSRQSNGDWHAQTEKVPNGLWIRVPSIKVKNSCTFQIGEQKLRLTIS